LGVNRDRCEENPKKWEERLTGDEKFDHEVILREMGRREG